MCVDGKCFQECLKYCRKKTSSKGKSWENQHVHAGANNCIINVPRIHMLIL